MDRRAFLQLLTAGAGSAAFPASIARALEIPAYRRTGTIEDVEHVVFLMQENRSFDHYFGMLRGYAGSMIRARCAWHPAFRYGSSRTAQGTCCRFILRRRSRMRRGWG